MENYSECTSINSTFGNSCFSTERESIFVVDSLKIDRRAYVRVGKALVSELKD